MFLVCSRHDSKFWAKEMNKIGKSPAVMVPIAGEDKLKIHNINSKIRIKCSKETASELSTLYQLCIRHITIHFAYYYTETSVFRK